MFVDNSGVMSAAAELGIDLNSLDEGSDFETETESTEAEGEVTEQAVETEPEESDLDETEAPEGEEKTEVQTETPVVEEEPKLTAKEFRELEAARTELATRETALKEERAAMEREFQEKYHEKVSTHDQMDDFFAHLADKDPELFDLIKGEFQEHQKQYSNPVLDATRKEIQELKNELKGFKEKTADEVTRTKLDAEMTQVKSTLGKEAEAAGLKIDWAKVEDAWADNPKLGLKNAFYAEYGESLVKASASKAKVDAVEKKVAARPAVSTAGNVSRSTAPVTQNFSKMNTRDVVGYFAKQLTGKA